jgi:hypothetical protein
MSVRCRTKTLAALRGCVTFEIARALRLSGGEISRMGAAVELPEVIEPVPVQDVYVTGIMPIEFMGDTVRVTDYVDRFDPVLRMKVREIKQRRIYAIHDWEMAVRNVILGIALPECRSCPHLLKVRH